MEEMQTRHCKQKVHSKPTSVHSWLSGHPGTARQVEAQRPDSSGCPLREKRPGRHHHGGGKGNERTGTREGSPDQGAEGQRTDPQHLAPSSPSCAMSLLISTSTGGWAGSQRGGDNNSIHLRSHFMEAWPLISKSSQNMCQGRAEALAQAAGGTGWHCSSSESTAAQGAVHPDTWQSPESSF